MASQTNTQLASLNAQHDASLAVSLSLSPNSDVDDPPALQRDNADLSIQAQDRRIASKKDRQGIAAEKYIAALRDDRQGIAAESYNITPLASTQSRKSIAGKPL